MFLIPVIILCAFVIAALSSGILPPPNAITVVHVRKGVFSVTKGKLRPHARDDAKQILAEAGVTKGFVAITKDNRVVFSREIPQEIHQRLRNVLLNQWA